MKNVTEIKPIGELTQELEKQQKEEQLDMKIETKNGVEIAVDGLAEKEKEVKEKDVNNKSEDNKTNEGTEKSKPTAKGKGRSKEKENIVIYKRETRIEKSRQDKTIKSLNKIKNKLRFDLAIQRNEVWTNDQKSNLIHSILYGYPIPPVMVQETDDDYIWFLDGKQRLTTIISFLNDEWALTKNTPEVYGFTIAGHKFSDLTEDMQDTIYDETITLIKLKNMTDEERDEMFIRWNSGTGLSKIELTRAMHTELIEQVNEISELEFFAESISLTGTARNRFQDQEIILQIAMLLDDGKNNIKGFGSKEIKEYVLRLKSVNKVLPDKVVKQFKDVSHYLSMAVHDYEHAERKKALKKIHIPIIFHTAIKAMKEKVKFSDFGVFVKDFLITDYSVESDYGQACQKGSSKKEAVLTRLNEMDLSLDEFIEILNVKKEKGTKLVDETVKS